MAVSRRQREQIRKRARDCCEYCQLPATLDAAPFQVDHVRAEKHHGRSEMENLAWACFPCNNHKSCNVAGYDPETQQLLPLFNPREQDWDEHFEWNGPILYGKTAIGRTTIDVLAVNSADRVAYRNELIKEGLFPPRRT